MTVEGAFCLALIILPMIWLNIYLRLLIRRIDRQARARPSDPASSEG